MPELPEVETVVRDLRPLLVGRSFESIQVSGKALRVRWQRAWANDLQGKRVACIDRRGKWIVIETDQGTCLLVHLGMTGQFTVVAEEMAVESHTHVVFRLSGAHHLRFRDVRRFGSVAVHATRADIDQQFADMALGPEPFDLDRAYWAGALAASKRNLKAVLLDQSVVAGVGNIYADESLFEARLNPMLIAQTLKPAQATALRLAIAKVLTRAIDKRGSSIRDYIGGSGLKGEMQHEFCAYGRTGKPCVRCGKSIVKITLAGRSTHFCPKCQAKRA